MNAPVSSFATKGILYYPTIEFQSETWVKAALMFWDTIYRIVPPNYVPKDSDELLIAKQNGFIHDIELTEKDLSITADKFESFCNKLQFYPAGFDASTYEVRLHSDKIDARLQHYFKHVSYSPDKNGFYKLPEKIANGYMFYLSEVGVQFKLSL